MARGCFTTCAKTRFDSSFAVVRFRAPWRCSCRRAIFGGSRTMTLRPQGRGSAGGGESRARSGRCQPARRTTGRHVFSNASNRGGVRSKWCGDEPDPTRPSKSPGSFSRRFAPQGVGFRELRARCRKAALNEQGTRGARRKALNRSELEISTLRGGARTSLSRRLPRWASLRGASVPEVRFEPFARVPVLATEGTVCDRCGLPSPHVTRLWADPKSPQ